MDPPWFVRFHDKHRLQMHIINSYRTLPEKLFTHFVSNHDVFVKNCMNVTNDWVSARFTPSDDRLLCLGGNEGSIALFNVTNAVDEKTNDFEKGVISCLPAHSGAVMGVYGVPNKSNELLSIGGGDGTAKIFDMEKKIRLACFDGHDTTVRSASFAPNNSEVFATCGRDGKFCLHDRRCQSKLDRNNMPYIPARHCVADAHFTSENGKIYKEFSTAPALTNIIYLDDNTVITSSDKSISGVRFWDLRKLSKRPYRTLCLPRRRESKQLGVVSMDVNRFSSSLFVAVTDNSIYEFLIGSGRDIPIRRLSHVNTTSYDLTISASPVSDNLLSGSVDNGVPKALIYNIPAKHSLESDISNQLEEITPAFQLGGHSSNVTSVSWSCYGNYVVTLDESSFRIWYPNMEKDNNEKLISKKDSLPSFQRAKFVGDQYEKQLTVNKFQKLMVSPIKSPFKSPVKKRMKTNDTSSAKKHKEFELFCCNDFLKNLPRRSNSEETTAVMCHKYNSNQAETPKKKPQRNLTDFFLNMGTRNSVGPSEINEPFGFSDASNTVTPSTPTTAPNPVGNSIRRYFPSTPLTRRMK